MRRFLLFSGLALLSLAAIWALSWQIMAGRVVSRVEAWAEARRAEGLAAEHKGIDVGGFPFRWQVTIANPTLAGGGSTNWVWQGDAVEADLLPFAIRDIALRFPGDHVFSAGAGSLGDTWK